MDEKRLQKVRENLNRHNERKKNQNIMSEVDSSKFDKTSSTYNKYDEGFERAKYHYQNSYLPKKAQKYYETVSEYKSPYQAVNKPSEDNTTVLTPDNLIANNLADGGYLDENTRNYVQKRTDEAFNNQYKKYAEQYSRINSRGKEAYNAAQNAQKTANEINSNVDKFYSQFKDGSDYANYLKNKASAEENARLLSYDIPAARQKLITMKALNMNPNVNVEDTDEYKAIVSDIEKAEAAQQFAKDMQNDNFRKEYEEFVQFQKDYENKNILEKGAEQVGNAVGDAIYNTSHGIYGVAKAANGILNSIFGVDTTQEGTLANNIDNFFEYEQGIKDRKDRYSSYYKIGLQNDVTNIIGNEDIGNFIGGKIFESLNAQADAGLSMALAFATGGGSTVAKGLQAVSGLTKAQKISQAVTSVMKGLAKNPNFWYSFVREGGSAYNDAIASGATQEEALINLLATGTVNGYIEVSGGVEKVPNLKGRGIKAWLNEITKTSFEEGFEEVKQGVVSELVKRLTYAPETKLFSDAEDGSGIINPKRMYDEFYGGAVGGVFGGVVGKGINAASYVIANNMYKSDTMRSIIQSGQYADLVASMPESDFTKSDISKMFTSDMTEEQILKSLKKVSNKSLRKQYDSMISALSKISTDNVAGIIFTATGDLDLASQTAPIIRKLYDGQAITDDEAKTILKDERIAYLISETSGYDLTNASYEDVVTLAERGSFENLSGTSTGNSFGDLLLGNSQRAEEGRNYIASIQDKYANDLIGKPTFTANVGENETVTIEGIDHIEDGEVYVKLSNGVIQEAQSLDTDEVTTALLSYASEYDTETASAFIGGYSGNISVGEYARSFAMTRSAALTGLSAQQIASAAPMALSNIGQTAFDAAVKSVQEKAKSFASADEKATQKAQANQAKRLDKVSVKDKTGNTSTKEQKRLARFISKATGYTVTLVDSRNGYINKVNGVKAIGEFNSTKGEIVLDIGSDNVMATALHEVTHYIKLNAPDEYKALCNFIIEYATRTGKIEEYLNAYTNGYKIDNVYELTEEMTADAAEALIQSDKFVEDIFNDADFVNAIAEEKQGIVRKFIDTLKSIVEAIKNYLKNGDVNHRIAAQLAQDVEALEQYEKLWVDALHKATRNHIASNINTIDTSNGEGIQLGNEDGFVPKSEYSEDAAEYIAKKNSTSTMYTNQPKVVYSKTGKGYVIGKKNADYIGILKGMYDRNILTTAQKNKYDEIMRKKGNDKYLRSFDITGEQILEYLLSDENGNISKESKRMLNDLKSIGNLMKEAAKNIKLQVLSLDDVNNAQIYYNPKTGEVNLSAMVKNGDYPINFDFTTICKKRVNMQAIVDRLIENAKADSNGEYKIDLSQENLLSINKALSKEGYETACLGCFVESKRYNINAWATSFVEKWNSSLEKAIGKKAASAKGYLDFAKGDMLQNESDIDDEAISKLIEEYKSESKNYKENSAAVKKGKGGKNLTNEEKITSFIKTHPEFQGKLQLSDIITSSGIENLSNASSELRGLLAGHYGTATPKMTQGFIPYNSEIALLSNKEGDEALRDYLFSIAGIRLQSFSDFRIEFVMDYFQMFADLAARQFPLHAYTKEIWFAKLFGKMGAKINMSVMFNVKGTSYWEQQIEKQDVREMLTEKFGITFNKDGKLSKTALKALSKKLAGLELDENNNLRYLVADKLNSGEFYQSINLDEAAKLQEQKGYSGNIGIIGVGYGDELIIMMLDDKRFKYIIPYHKSGLAKVLQEGYNLSVAKDYTSEQNTSNINFSLIRLKGQTEVTGFKVNVNGTEFNIGTKTGFVRCWNALKQANNGNIESAMQQFVDAVEKNCYIKTNNKKGKHGQHADFDIYADLEKTNDPRMSASNYIDYCMSNGCLPMFWRFAGHHNYYKLNYDFTVYKTENGQEVYAPQESVKWNLPDTLPKTISLIEGMLEEQANSDRVIRTKEQADKIIDEAEVNKQNNENGKANNVRTKNQYDNIVEKKFSLSETDESKEYSKFVEKFFGTTYDWDETGYILNNGKQLDFSGKNDGGISGSRNLDHREIVDAFSDLDYYIDEGRIEKTDLPNSKLIDQLNELNGAEPLIDFLRRGNIRIMPETGGINLSVEPSKAQYYSLSDYISKNRGEVILDIDDESGNTIASVEYPRGTHSSKVINDIKNYFENGAIPYLSTVSEFHTKFSLSDRTSAEYDLLTQENEELKAQVEALKNEMKLTKGHKVNPEAVKKLAKKYLKDYSSTADIDEVSAKLKEIFDYVASDNAYAEVAQKAMYELAYNIINNSETLNTEMRDEFKDILDVIKSTPIYVDSTTKAEIESLYGDYNSFRKSMFGRMRLTTNKNGKGLYSNETVDSLNQTLSEMLPGTFPADVSEGDALANIVDFIEMTKPTMQNEFEGNVKEAAYQLAAEMFDDYFDTPEIKTFADKQQAKLNKVINENRKARAELKQKIRTEQKEIYEKKLAEIKEKQKAKLTELRADRDEKLDALRKEKNERISEIRKEKNDKRDSDIKALREQKNAKLTEVRADRDEKLDTLRKEKNERISEIRKEKNDKRDADVKALREQKNAELAEVRADREAKLQALREVYKERNEKKREKADIAKLKSRIAKLVKSLSNDLLTNSQKHHIPEELKKITGELLANINLMSAKQEAKLNSNKPTKVALKMQNDLNKLRLFIKDYGALESDKDGNNNYTINFDPDLDANIKKFEEYLQMVVDRGVINIRDMNIEELTAVHNMLAALRKAVNDVNKAYSNRLTQAITEIAEGSIAEINAKRDRPNLDDGIKKVVGLLDNYANFQMLDSRSFFYNMGDSSFKIHQALRDGLDIRTQKLQEAQAFFKDALSSFTKKEIKEIIEEAYDFDVTGGKLHMTKAQIMSLYELNKREQGKEHIYKGGIRPTNTKNKRNPKPIMVNQEDVLRIVSTLSNEEIKLADSIQKFLAKNCAAWGNEVTMDMYGYKKFVEEFYFPITSFYAQVNTNDNNASNGADKASMFTILNYGMTKALTPNANNAIDIINIFDVATKHIVEMSNYAGYAKPLSDAMRWFNYRNRSTGESVKGSMYAKYENKGDQYFVELIRDINNQKATGDYGGEITSMLVSGAKTASIAANLSVVVQQPTAFVRAGAVLNPDILMKGAVVATKHIKKSMAEVMQYCPIAYWKSQGYFDTSLGKNINETITGIKSKKDAIVEASMSLAGLMDDVTWAAIWESTKIWVQENHPDVAVDSQAFFDIASEKFRDVVDQTQVVDTVLHRPMILRSKNRLVKMSFAFMSEPLKSANLVRNAALDMRYKKPGAKHKFVRALASSVLANLAAAATKAIIMALRDTGDDDWLTKWLNSFLDDAKNSINPFNLLPIVKDIISMLKGFDVERMDMTAIAGIVDFAKKVFDYAQKDKLDDLFNLNTVYTLTRYLSQLTGVPVYNVLRDVDAFIDIFGDPIFRKPNTSTSTRVQKLYDAAMANDTEAFNNVYNTLRSEGKTQKEIESSLKSKIIDDSRGNAMFNELVDKAAKERINGNISESVRIVKELASTTALSADFWKACVNARINKLNGRSEDREELISTGISRELVDTMSDDEVKEALKSYQNESTSYTSDSLTEDTGTVSMYTANDLVKSIQDGDYNEYSEMYQDMLEVKVTNLLMKAEQENKELTVDEAEEKARKSIKSSMTDGLKKLIKSLYNSDKAKYRELKKWLMKNLDYSSKTIEGWLTEKE